MSNSKDVNKDKTELDTLQACLNNSPDIALLIRIDDYRLAAINERARKEYRYTKKQFLTLHVFDIEAHPQQDKEVLALYKNATIGTVVTYEGFNKRKDGSEFPVEVRFSKINSTFILANIKNTSEQAHAGESNIVRAQMVKDAGVAMFAMDVNLILTDWSKGCESFFGYAAKDILGAQTINLAPSKMRPKLKRFLRQVMKELELGSMDIALIHNSGEHIETTATCWVTNDHNGIVNGVVVLVRDNSTQKKIQKVQETVLNIAQASSRRIIDTNWFSKFVVQELGNIMNVDNLYIILYDKASKSYTYPIMRGCKGLRKTLEADKNKKTLFQQVIGSGKPLFEQKPELLKYIKAHKIQMETQVPEVYLGVPLKGEGKVVGVLAVQSFNDPFAYSIRIMMALEFVSKLLSNILSRDLIINELMTSEEHFRSLSEKSGDVISLLDKDWVIQYESLPSKHVFGKLPHEVLGHNFLEYIHPDHKTEIKKCLTAVSKVKDKIVIATCRYLHGNGSWIWAELNVKNLLSDKVVKGILIHKKDITKSHETDEKLKSSEAKFKSLFTQSLEAIYLVDPLTRTVIDANQSFLDHTGYKKEDYGRIALEDFVEASVTSINGYINKVLAGTHVENVERIWKKQSGEHITVLISGSTIKIGHKEIVVASGRDISAQKKTEFELLKINKELDTFVYKASHDLRGPLTTCLGLVNMSRDEVKEEKAIWYLSMINDVLGKLDGILTDLTQITSIRQGNVESVKINLNKLVKEVISEFNGHPDTQNFSFETDLKLKKQLESDPAILKMVFRNLIGNAIKYKKVRSMKAKLKISATQNENSIKVLFDDNGIGIDKQVVNLIFEMFFRGTTASDGSGLGLYMVRTGLDKINASIIVESKLGKGSRFLISLPNATS